MGDETFQPDRLTLTEEDVGPAPGSPRRPRRSKRVTEARCEETASSPATYDRSAPRGYSLMRTRRLLMAALRVWELKKGIHSSY
jgi:hypothetical protein